MKVLLRPEDLVVLAAGGGPADGQVLTCAFFGSYYELTVQTPGAILRLRHRQPARPGEHVGIDWGQVAGIAYPTESPGGLSA